MAERPSADKLHLGFLRIVALDAGFVGGLLVTNRIGRPLEFQCTAPVKPNRTQELLYGPTLESFLYSEVLGKALCERVAVKAGVLLVAQSELLPLREHVDAPVIVLPENVAAGASPLDAAELHPDFPQDRDWIERLKQTVPASADIHEPLERVKDALLEALRSAA